MDSPFGHLDSVHARKVIRAKIVLEAQGMQLHVLLFVCTRLGRTAFAIVNGELAIRRCEAMCTC
jgi:hypothetical protein